MSEMELGNPIPVDYEKKHKEEVVRATQLWECGDITRENLEYIFPELRESEDEKIRKEIIAFLKENLETGRADETWSLSGLERWIAWLEKQAEKDKLIQEILSQQLEKQGEQKTFDYEDTTIQQKDFAPKPEPKFKVRDWLQYRNAKPFFVEQITKQGYVNGDSCLPFNWENEIHLWSITDAKDGDVLVHNSITFIFKGIEDGIVKGLCLELSDSILNFGEPEYDKDYSPATKEQRELLFQKMKEAGWEWNAEKKMLSKIVKSKIRL